MTYNADGITVQCACPREECVNEMRIVPVKTDEGWTIMMTIAKPHEWGTMNVRTVVLDQTACEALSVILANPDVFAHEH